MAAPRIEMANQVRGSDFRQGPGMRQRRFRVVHIEAQTQAGHGADVSF